MKIFFNPYLLFPSLALLSQSALAQHTWSYDFEVANASSPLSDNTGWGSSFSTNSTVYNSVTGAPVAGSEANFNTFGQNHGVRTSESAEDVGGLIVRNNINYNATAVYNPGSFDIGNNGDSLTINMFWQAGNFQNGRSAVPVTGGTNEVLQLGIGDSTSTEFGASANYLYLAGIEESWSRPSGSFVFTDQNHDLSYHVISGSDSTIQSSSQLTSSDVLHLRRGPTFPELYWYEYELTFLNNNGNLDIDINVDQWRGGFGTTPASFVPTVETDTSFYNATLNNVSHSLDLTQIRPGLGIFVRDADTVASSGTTFDNFNTQVPEPSSFIFLVSGFCLALGKRRRK